MSNKVTSKVPILQSLSELYQDLPISRRQRRRLIRWGIIAGNFLLLLGVGIFVISNRSVSQTIRSSTVNAATSTASSVTNPLDRLSSAQIALNVAQMVNMPETTPIRNQADSDALLLSVVPNDATVLAKPQIVSTAQKSKRDIVHYTTVSGDTLSSLSNKFGVDTNSIRWSNSNIAGENLKPGINLVIPPVNGIVYTVKAGDSAASLAKRYYADEGQIIAYNDAEINGLRPGEEIIIPSGRIQATVTFRSFFAASYGGNGYDFGYCTWYAAEKVSVPRNWGNANTWDNYAALSGWIVSSRPVKGAILQTDRGWAGHVGYVEEVSADGSMIKYSDMNGLAGWGRVGYSDDWVPASKFPHYIYR